MNLANKTLIVTGASRGIGQALSLELARVGVRLVLNARTKEPLEEPGFLTTPWGATDFAALRLSFCSF